MFQNCFNVKTTNEYIILKLLFGISDLIGASDLLFEDQEGRREIVTNVAGFGRQKVSPDDAFATVNNPFILDNPFVVDKMQVSLIRSPESSQFIFT